MTMRKIFDSFQRGWIALCCLLLLSALPSNAANTKKTVSKVSTTVELTTDVDYVVAGSTPFDEAGIVNIVNTDHAVLILSKVKPSAAIQLLASHVQINGAKAVNNSNCQVKLYNRGCIIMPYAKNIKPLTVYSEKNFEGESCNDFGLEHSGGYMNTLTAAKLNNKIRSFKLKRGYMVTFSLLSGGRGYSRCFIAAYEDLEMAELPAVMDQKISSYRVFQWYDTNKVGLADASDAKEVCDALNVTTTYEWWRGKDANLMPDVECVPHHYKENYPTAAACGSSTTSAHLKTTNEPRNPADEPKNNPESLELILSNWESLMRTGMRLCSPSSWDGSDYVGNAGGFLREFFDSIDARGWRCDIVDLHCYWADGTFNSMKNWTNAVHRPIWVSEWVWGASWNNNGIFGEAQGDYRDNPTTDQLNRNRDMVQSICNKMNGYDFVERYYYWNGEANCSKLYYDGKLTPAGEVYSNMESGLGYNGKYDYVPTTPKQSGLTQYSKVIADGKTTLKWYDPNGEFNQKMEVQKKNNSGEWETYAVIEQKEEAASYTFVIDSDDADVEYRVYMVDLNGKEYSTVDEKTAGDVVDIDGTPMYVGGNLLLNGDFDLGLAGWTNGLGQPLAAPYFQVVPTGGYRGGSYLQAYGNALPDTEQSIKTVFDMETNQYYYFSAAEKNVNSVYSKISLSTNGKDESKQIASLKTSEVWDHQSLIFNSGSYPKLILGIRWLGNKGQLDKMELRKLYASRDEAITDGVALLRQRAAMVQSLNTKYPGLNSHLDAVLASLTGTTMEDYTAMEKAIANLQASVSYMGVIDSLQNVLQSMSTLKCINYDEMAALLNEATTQTDPALIADAVQQVKAMMNTYMDFRASKAQPSNPTLSKADGWETKVGTYQGGDQRVNSKGGKTFWNAWWSVAKSEVQNGTMEIRQTVKGLSRGYYVMECKATTEHYCLSDQHGYLKYGSETVTTPNLANDYFDLPVENIWETLTTSPVYVEENGEVTIGFVGSKQGAVDGQWKQYGGSGAPDNREGWWCATDFTLKYVPVYKRTVTPNQWDVVCLPFKMRPVEGVKIYRIAGINPDYNQLCLEEVSEVEAGEPCIFRSETAEAMFYEYGDSVKAMSWASGNLRGFYRTTAKAPVGYYILKNGSWEKVPSDRPAISPYTGLIYPMTNNSAKAVAVMETWAGETMPINGVTEEEKNANSVATSVKQPVLNILSQDGIYTLDGRMVSSQNMKSGLYIKVENGKVYKMIRK
jgi:hypothetical protein